MKRVTMIAPAVALALLGLAGRAAAQQVDTNERTFLTFSTAVEMPGVTLQPGTYVFRLGDASRRNVVQVWDRDERNMLGHFTFIETGRPRRSDETVVMFKETQEDTAPAIQYWYYPGHTVGKEFIYSKDQAARIAKRSGATVRTEDGVVEPGPVATSGQEKR